MDKMRITACVNACAGMDDPAAEIARLRSRAAEAHQWEEMAERTGLPLKPEGAEAEIARLREIESQAKAAGFIGPDGKVRKVLGTLPITADGCIAEYGRTYWCWCRVPVFDGSSPFPSSWRIDVVEKCLESCDPCEEYIGDYTKYPPACFSTREAAEAAREGNK